jgi:hypothetical protein
VMFCTIKLLFSYVINDGCFTATILTYSLCPNLIGYSYTSATLPASVVISHC